LRKRNQKARPEKPGARTRRRIALVALGIAALSIAAFWQVTSNPFINYDDAMYVTGNPYVQAGLAQKSIVWALSTTHTGNWTPLTWLSHMLDCQFFSLRAGGHHLTSLVLHTTSALLLLGLLHRLTSHLWRSAFVAGIFAVHPINVESVAWVAERKSVLCTLLWLVTIWAYLHYTAKPDWKRYLLVVIAFAAALMAKPMAVTLPFALLLIDYWPLGRLRLHSPSADGEREIALSGKPHQQSRAEPRPRVSVPPPKLLLEKLPLVLLAIGDCLITFKAQRESGSIRTIATFPVGLRLENSLLSYIGYIKKLLWPSGLAVFYPFPRSHPPVWEVGLAAIGLAGITLLALGATRRLIRYPSVGWLWYLGTLVPVIGLIQVGGQSMADRYAYIPMLGVLILVVWSIASLTSNRRPARNTVIAVALITVLGFALATRNQVGYWSDSEALFDHAQQVTDDNYVAFNNLGEAVAAKGRPEEAERWFAKAVQADPTYTPAHENLGMALIQEGRLDEGVASLTRATELDPGSYTALNKLGAALARKGQLDDALGVLNHALQLNPSFAPTLANQGIVLEQQGKFEDAAVSLEKAVQNAASVDLAVQFHCRLANVLVKKGEAPQAAEEYRTALKLSPGFAPAIEGLRRIPPETR